ncbi:hypothetical protein [Aquaspirillum sp. LM1]|uniref:hypothetical protein n=1 Tax=Aquaspirillum sp. LM1 TaxID=1938604 RepID=UPI0015C564F3|nr:hypothetical protein [Aquaspirillum sp. LM1]
MKPVSASSFPRFLRAPLPVASSPAPATGFVRRPPAESPTAVALAACPPPGAKRLA